jgi:protein phosphatase
MQIVDASHLDVFHVTHPGMKGKVNEDRFGYASFVDPEPGKSLITLGVLCDGIGGHHAGEIAADLAVRSIIDGFASSDEAASLDLLKKSVVTANQLIFQESQKDQMHTGMGSTCACVLVIDRHLYTCNIGDSRIYLLRNKVLTQVSTDHTWVQEAIETGLIQPVEAETHPNRHVLRRYLGSSTPPRVDTRLHLAAGESDAQSEANQGLLLDAGDIVLLCSDGLTDLVQDNEIEQALTSKPLQEAIEFLVSLANRRGGYDNITILLMQVPTKQSSLVKRPRRRWILGCLLIFLFTILLAVGVLYGIGFMDKLLYPEEAITPGFQFEFPTQASISIPTVDQDFIATETSMPLQAKPDPATVTPWPAITIYP